MVLIILFEVCISAVMFLSGSIKKVSSAERKLQMVFSGSACLGILVFTPTFSFSDDGSHRSISVHGHTIINSKVFPKYHHLLAIFSRIDPVV